MLSIYDRFRRTNSVENEINVVRMISSDLFKEMHGGYRRTTVFCIVTRAERREKISKMCIERVDSLCARPVPYSEMG